MKIFKCLAIYLASYLVFYPSAYAAVVDWDMGTASDYTYDSAKIGFSGGVASLTALDFTDNDNAATGFGGGTHSNTEWSVVSSIVRLTSPNTSGSFLSRVFDAGASIPWNGTLAWTPERPSLKELPNSAATESGYSTGNVAMTNNKLLLHFNDTNWTDDSGNAHNFTGNGNAAIANGLFNSALTLDGSGDYLSLADHADFDVGTGSFSIALWFKTSSAGNRYIVSDYGAAGWKLWKDGSGNICFGVDDDSSWGPDTSLCTAGTNYADNAWHHVVAVKTTVIELEIFMDGAEAVSTTTLSGGSAPPDVYFPTASAHDGTERQSDGYWNSSISHSDLYLGRGSYIPGIIFPVTIDPSVTITNAYVSLTSIYNQGSSIGCTWKGHKALDSPDLTVNPPTYQLRDKDPLTTAGVLWTMGSVNESTSYNTPDLTSIIQEVVGQDGWTTSSRRILLMCRDGTGSTQKKFASYDHSSLAAPSLTIVTNAHFSSLNNDAAMMIGSNSTAGSYFSGNIDETAFFNDRALTSAEALDLYKRGALRARFQVESCDDSACSGETFIGPDGTADTYYEEQDMNTTGLPSFTLTNVPDKRWFRYQIFLETDDSSITPGIGSVVLGPTHYNAGDPTIVNSTVQSYTSLSGFAETLGGGNWGTVKYQISNNDGAVWYWWNGSAWASTGSGYSESSTAANINTNIGTFAPDANKNFRFRAFLHSANGTQAVELSNIGLVYTLGSSNTAPSFTVPGNQTINEDAVLNGINIANIADAEQGAAGVSFSASSSNTNIIANNNIVIGTLSGTSRSIQITPTANANGGPVTITITGDDGQGLVNSTSQQTFTVTVTAVDDAPGGNRAPTITTVSHPASMDGYICQKIREQVLISVTGTDPDNDTLTYTMSNRPVSAPFITGSASNWVFLWAPTETGATRVTFTVTDPGSLSASAAHTIVAVNLLDDCAQAIDVVRGAEGVETADDGSTAVVGKPIARTCFGKLTDTEGVCVTTRIVRSGSTVNLDGRSSYQPAATANGTSVRSNGGLIYHWSQVATGGCQAVTLSDNGTATAAEPSFKTPDVPEGRLIQCQFNLYVENEFGMSEASSRAIVKIVGNSSEENATEVPYAIYGQVSDGIVVRDPTLRAEGSGAVYNANPAGNSSSSSILSIVKTNGKITNLTDFTKVERVSSLSIPSSSVHTYNFRIAEAATGAGGANQYVITTPNYDDSRGAIFKFDRDSIVTHAGQGGGVVSAASGSSFTIDRFYGSAQGEFLGAGMAFADTNEDGIIDLMFKRRDVANSASYIVGLDGGDYMGSSTTVDNDTFSFMIGGQDVDLRNIAIVQSREARTNGEMEFSQGAMIDFLIQGRQTMNVDIRNDVTQVIGFNELYDRLVENGRARTAGGFNSYNYNQYRQLQSITNTGGSVSVLCPTGYRPPAGFRASGCEDSAIMSVDLVSADESGDESVVTAESTNVGAGDINNDGHEDTVLGDPAAGFVYVFFGTATLTGAGDTASADVAIRCVSTSDGCGDTVLVGDLSGDGYDDIIIGAPGAGGQYEKLPNAGEIYVIYGNVILPSSIDVAAYADMNIIYGSTEAGYLGLEMVIIDADNNGVKELACNLRTGGAIIISFDTLQALGRTLRVDQLGLTTADFTDPSRVTMINMNLSASVDEAILIDTITLTAAGTGADDSDIAAVLLFEDTNHSGEYDEGDIQIGSAGAYDYDDGNVVFTSLGKTLPAGESAVWFVVYEFSADGTSGLSVAAARGADRAVLPFAILLTTVLVIAAGRSRRLRIGVFAIMLTGQGILFASCHSNGSLEVNNTFTYQANITESAHVGAKGVSSGEAVDILGAPMAGTEVSVTYTNGQPGTVGFQGGGGCDSLVGDFGDSE